MFSGSLHGVTVQMATAGESVIGSACLSLSLSPSLRVIRVKASDLRKIGPQEGDASDTDHGIG